MWPNAQIIQALACATDLPQGLLKSLRESSEERDFPVARGGEGLFGRMANYPTQAKSGLNGPLSNYQEGLVAFSAVFGVGAWLGKVGVGVL